jgi:hypothetical protein
MKSIYLPSNYLGNIKIPILYFAAKYHVPGMKLDQGELPIFSIIIVGKF